MSAIESIVCRAIERAIESAIESTVESAIESAIGSVLERAIENALPFAFCLFPPPPQQGVGVGGREHNAKRRMQVVVGRMRRTRRQGAGGRKLR